MLAQAVIKTKMFTFMSDHFLAHKRADMTVLFSFVYFQSTSPGHDVHLQTTDELS